MDLRGAIENTRAVREHLGRRFAGRRFGGGRAFNLALFSCDHRWRSIADALNRLAIAADDQFTEYCEIALEAYLGYLRSREAALRVLLHRRAGAAVAG